MATIADCYDRFNSTMATGGYVFIDAARDAAGDEWVARRIRNIKWMNSTIAFRVRDEAEERMHEETLRAAGYYA